MNQLLLALLTSLFLFPTTVMAQKKIQNRDSSSIAPEILKALGELRKKHIEAKDWQVEFEMKVYSPIDQSWNTSESKMVWKKGDAFRLEMPGSIYVSNGKTLWEYHQAHNQVLIKSISGADPARLPAGMLLRFLEPEPLSAMQLKGKNRGVARIELDPQTAGNNLAKLWVYVKVPDGELVKVETADLSENKTVYQINKIKYDTGLSNANFTFTPPKGVEMVDMRE